MSQEGANLLLASVSHQLEQVIALISQKLIQKVGSKEWEEKEQDEDIKGLTVLRGEALRLKGEWQKHRSGVLKEYFERAAQLIASQVEKIKQESEKQRIELNLSVPELMKLILQKKGKKKEEVKELERNAFNAMRYYCNQKNAERKRREFEKIKTAREEKQRELDILKEQLL